MIYSRVYTAETAITAFTAVKPGASDTAVAAATAVGDRIIGVMINPTNAAINDEVEVCLLGECLMSTGGSIGRGQSCTINATGQAVTPAPAAGANVKIVGFVLISSASNVVPFFVCPSWYQG